jgi:hypothetical protein
MVKPLHIVLGCLLVLCSCDFGYGPVRDQSQFISARLMEDKRTIVFSYHHFRYRSATGWRAFPDGGIPKYLTDISIAGAYDLRTRQVKVLHRERNTNWQPGGGLLTVQETKGGKALFSQGGQLRANSSSGLRHLLVDVDRGAALKLDLKGDLAARGRDLGELHLVDDSGTMLFINLSVEEARNSNSRRDDSVTPEIWVRTPNADYLKAARSSHYEATRNGDVIYWDLPTREFHAFSIRDRSARRLTGYKVPAFEDVTEGVTLSSDKKGLEYGVKVNGNWSYRPLDLPVEKIRARW